MERYLADQRYASRRLLTFFLALFDRLSLADNQFTWSLIRVCVRNGFRVAHQQLTVESLSAAKIACYFCNGVAYGTLDEFVRMAADTYRVGNFGLVSFDHEVHHLAHRLGCDRDLRDIDDLSSYVDMLLVRRYFAVAIAMNQNSPSSSSVLSTASAFPGNNQLAAGDASTSSNGGGGGGGGNSDQSFRYICRICLVRVADVTTLPCGHVYACYNCLLTGTTVSDSCFVCRTQIQAIQQLYFA